MSKVKYDILQTRHGEFKTTLNRAFLARKPWKPANPNHILSFMPGTVEELKVKKGDKVKAGEILMVFRAMKMKNNILSPVTGKVKSINVSAGDNIPKDTVMIEIG